MPNLANWLTLARLTLAPILLLPAADGHRRAFLAVLGLSVLTDALDGPAIPFRIAVAILAIAAIEEMQITFVLPRPYTDVPSLWHALSLVRRYGQRRHAAQARRRSGSSTGAFRVPGSVRECDNGTRASR
jgi:hypothetical protein